MPTIQNRRATAAQWTTANPVLAAGEIGFELDTNALKVGDGITPWGTLRYLSDESIKTLVQSGRLSEATLNDTYGAMLSTIADTPAAIPVRTPVTSLRDETLAANVKMCLSPFPGAGRARRVRMVNTGTAPVEVAPGGPGYNAWNAPADGSLWKPVPPGGQMTYEGSEYFLWVMSRTVPGTVTMITEMV